MKILFVPVLALIAVSADAARAHPVWFAQYQPLTQPMMPSHSKKRHRHIYYGIGGSKHQTATGGPVGGIGSRN